ncbi:MAG: nuclear transport factor 2 family protein [Bacteroidota bacterium]
MRTLKTTYPKILMVCFAIGLLALLACEDASAPPAAESVPDPSAELQKVVEDYIATYQAREDWEKLLSFYSDSLYFIDINMKYEFHDKAGFMAFYDWPNPQFSKLSPEQKHFLMEDLIVKDQTAIIKGRFQPFYWKGDLKEWTDLFTMWLHFNDDHKIIRQYDFIKYPKQFLPE